MVRPEKDIWLTVVIYVANGYTTTAIEVFINDDILLNTFFYDVTMVDPGFLRTKKLIFECFSICSFISLSSLSIIVVS